MENTVKKDKEDIKTIIHELENVPSNSPLDSGEKLPLKQEFEYYAVNNFFSMTLLTTERRDSGL